MSALVLSTFITTHYKPKRFSMLSLECVEGGQSWSEHYNDCIFIHWEDSQCELVYESDCIHLGHNYT